MASVDAAAPSTGVVVDKVQEAEPEPGEAEEQPGRGGGGEEEEEEERGGGEAPKKIMHQAIAAKQEAAAKAEEAAAKAEAEKKALEEKRVEEARMAEEKKNERTVLARKDVGRSAARAKRDNDRLQRINDASSAMPSIASAVEMQRNHRNEAEVELGEQESSKEEGKSEGRWNPAQKRLLERMRWSKAFWKQQREKDGGSSKADGAGGPSGSRPSTRASGSSSRPVSRKKASHASIWEAAEKGDLKALKDFVQMKRFDVRKHDYMHDKGTLLHKAAWYSHAPLIRWLLEHVKRRYGEDALRAFVNDVDSYATGTTALINAASTRIGVLNDRLDVIKHLLEAGARIEHKDAHGDTALHWAARNGSLPVVKFLLKSTEGAVFASMLDNFAHKRPLDVALEQRCERVIVIRRDTLAGTVTVRPEGAPRDEVSMQRDVPAGDIHPLVIDSRHHAYGLQAGEERVLCETHSDRKRDELYFALLAMLQGSNVRIKIQRNRKRREEEEHQRKLDISEARAQILEEARVASEVAEVEWLRQRQEAEKVRQADEDALVAIKSERAVEEAVRYMDTREGKAEIKMRARNIEREKRNEYKARDERAPKKLSKQCYAQAQGEFVHEREEDARIQAIRTFRRSNPADFDKREQNSLAHAASTARKRFERMAAVKEQRLKDDIDENTGLCSEPELNLNPYCRDYTGW